ncbi:hypothetical protein QVD17_05141 [Tagetes erecta]|uniref:Prolamin-like domain-containing protein n=1 Tax=Tagetes erecta TaxID=13708 RepID=A0AAD8LBF1_TARER|nr:hypothetical protein QVD17_05141 [Tagetes erecta]
MAYTSPIIMLTLVLVATMTMLVHTRPLPASLEARLRLNNNTANDGDQEGCWETLFELHSCTGEIILFFLNGETYLGMGCCRAIEEIQKQCWPSLMGSIGFTSEEGDILRGFCDVSNNIGHHVPPPPPTTNATTSNVTHHGGF